MRARLRRWAVPPLAVALLIVMAASCGDGGTPHGLLGTSSGSGPPVRGPCADGAERACHVTLSEHNGVVLCYSGVETCSAGAWGECADGAVTSKSLSDGYKALSLSTPAACGNPCDPGCQEYDEIPMPAYRGTPTPTFQWLTGGAPTAASYSEPCGSASDCHTNSYCQNPATAASCEIEMCYASADPFDAACDPCVAAVCASDPTCCQKDMISCAARYGAIPGFVDCPGGSDERNCFFMIDATATTCSAECAAAGGTCASTYDSWSGNTCSRTGSNLGCSFTGDSSVLCTCSRPGAGAWDSGCTSLVHTLCGNFCGSTSTSARGDGECVAWPPGKYDSDCGGRPDLTVGVGCSGNVTICNVGSSTANPPINIIHYPSSDAQLGSCTPDQTLPSMSSCTVNTSIPRGTCANVTSCTDLTTGAAPRHIMVNPPGGGQISECHGNCQNNWGLWENVACQGPNCTNVFVSPTSATLTLGSVVDPVAPTTVTYDNGTTTQTMTQVAGAGSCTSGLQWYWNNATNPTAVVLCPSASSTVQSGADTCTGAGHYYYSTPQHCYFYDATTPTTWDAARTACQAWGGDLAVIGGSSEQSYVYNNVVSPGGVAAWLGGTDAGTEGTWRWEPLGEVPMSATTGQLWKYTNWDAAPLEPDGGAAENCLRMDEFGGYWDDDDCAALHPGVCERVKPTKRVIVSAPCPSWYNSPTFTETYLAVCPAGKGPQWAFLGWDTVTPGNSSVTFEVRSAVDVASLPAAGYVAAGTATSTPTDTQVCPLAPPPTGCAVDLYNLLGGVPDAAAAALEVRIRLYPTSPNSVLSPTVNGWTVWHSCVDNE